MDIRNYSDYELEIEIQHLSDKSRDLKKELDSILKQLERAEEVKIMRLTNKDSLG